MKSVLLWLFTYEEHSKSRARCARAPKKVPINSTGAYMLIYVEVLVLEQNFKK
jgi:hypothetical protein